jgi:YggT family protein
MQLVNFAFSAFELLILARVLVSWINADRYNPVVQFIYRVTEPILAPVRRILPPMGMMDFSPIVVIIAALIIKQIILQLLPY